MPISIPQKNGDAIAIPISMSVIHTIQHTNMMAIQL
jgi:hypothetical protein